MLQASMIKRDVKRGDREEMGYLGSEEGGRAQVERCSLSGISLMVPVGVL